MNGGMLAWLCVWVKVQICILPSWCHCHSLSLAPENPDWFYLQPFWCRLTRVVPDKIQEGRKTVVCVCWGEIFFRGRVECTLQIAEQPTYLHSAPPCVSTQGCPAVLNSVHGEARTRPGSFCRQRLYTFWYTSSRRHANWLHTHGTESGGGARLSCSVCGLFCPPLRASLPRSQTVFGSVVTWLILSELTL